MQATTGSCKIILMDNNNHNNHFSRKEEDHPQSLQEKVNEKISFLCRIVALVIAVLIFATTIVGQDNIPFVILGLSLSVALLAIAGLQNHSKRK